MEDTPRSHTETSRNPAAAAGQPLHFIERTACPLCQSQQVTNLYDQPLDQPPLSDYLRQFYDPQGGVEFEYLTGARQVLSSCDQCDLIYQRWIGNDALLERLYSRWIDPARTYELHHAQRPLVFYQTTARQILTLLHHFKASLDQPLRFLDFGMGWGEWCRMAAGFGVHAAGCELSQSRIDHARRFGIEVVDFEHIPGRQFHVINADQVFEHLADPLATLRHLVQGLHPSGLVHIAVPNGAGVRQQLNRPDWLAAKGSAKSLNAVAPLEHINCFSRRSLIALAQRAGLKCVCLPLRHQYAAAIDIRPGLPLLKSLIIPWYLNHMEPTNLWFCRASPGG